MKEKSKGIGLLIGLGKPQDDEESDGGARGSAAKAVLAAIRDDDAAALDEALKLHYDACSGMESEDSEEDEYSGDEE